jgi:tryptophanyl-tRNA synthetase
MNQEYGMDFPEPKRYITKGEYIPSLKGEGKMGKSVEGSYINLTDSLDEIRKKVRSIPTATEAGGEMTGGLKALFKLAELFLPDAGFSFNKQFEEGTLKFVEVKDAVADAIFNTLKPIQEKRHELESNSSYIDKVIAEGAEKARAIASETVKEVREKMGLA